jgi:hypothetical protein
MQAITVEQFLFFLLAWLAVPFCMPPLILGEDTLKGNIANIRTE